MSILTILKFPDQRLRIKAKKVAIFDNKIEALVKNMLDTMYEANGVGLAATQINVHKRIIVIDVSEGQNTPLCLINPEIIKKIGTEQSEEGCLSIPDIFTNISRAKQIKVKASDAKGTLYELDADSFLAVCIQHEMDHLEGKLLVDYLSPLKRQRIEVKLEKIYKRQNKKIAK